MRSKVLRSTVSLKFGKYPKYTKRWIIQLKVSLEAQVAPYLMRHLDLKTLAFLLRFKGLGPLFPISLIH